MSRPARPNDSPEVIDLGGAGRDKHLDSSDPLAAFHSEADWPQDVPVSAPRTTPPATSSIRAAGVSFPARIDKHSSPFVWIAILLAAVAVAEAPFVAMWIWNRPALEGNAAGVNQSGVTFGTVYVETEPAGMEVWVNGGAAGRTPTQLSIPVGPAEIQLRHAEHVRTVPLTITPEEVVRLRVELPPTIDESVGLSDRIPGSATDMMVVVSAEAEDLALIADPADELPSPTEQAPRSVALAQPLPAQ